MSNLTRYTMETCECNDINCDRVDSHASPTGEWVKFDDIKELLNTAHNSSSHEMPINDIVEKFAMAIVHRIGENCGVSVPVRQSTNDVNIDETIATIKQLLGTIGR